MMCSPQELGLPDQVEGLLVLREDAKIGQPFAEYLGRSGSDVVYDLEITPNRPDLNSVIGIAREISAVSGNPLRLPELQSKDTREVGQRGAGDCAPYPAPQPGAGGRVEELVPVRLDDSELCPRYTARVIRGVKVGPSP